MLQQIEPQPQTEAHQRLLAESLLALVTRLIAAGRVEEALEPAEEAVTAYRRAASATGADVGSLAGRLMHLSAVLTNAGRHAEAVAPAQAANEILEHL